MHHFIFPSKDTYISSLTESINKNYGIDELLQIGTSNVVLQTLNPTKEYVYTSVIFNGQLLDSFTGTFTGSLGGTVTYSNGTISGSTLMFSASYFSGSEDGNIVEKSGSVSGSLINGIISGSSIFPFVTGIFTGQLTGSNACLTGTGSGIDNRTQPNWTSATTQFSNRSLLSFNINSISSSIATGDIQSPSFFLNLKVCNEFELPIDYTIYAFPISQSWNLGDGFFSDGGSNIGSSWRYRDGNGGTQWYLPNLSGSRPPIDFITTPSLLTASFGYGGGTWYTASYCSQSFSYRSSDIKMNVTPIVMQWLSQSIPNNGIILVSSDELRSTGSGFILTFFSRDTNTIYSPYLDVAWVDSSFTTGSFSTSSVIISSISSGITSSIQSGSSITMNGGISGSFSGSAAIFTTVSSSITSSTFVGFVSGYGLSGNILNIPVIGATSGSISISQSLVEGPCGNSFYAQTVTASFNNGPFSSSTFTAYYIDGKFENAFLTGSWISSSLLGARVNVPIPSGIDPYAYAYVVGTYVNGTALGSYILSGSTSASYDGQFIDGNLLGSHIRLLLSGSVYTSSISYTSSIEITSSVLSQLDIEYPFVISISNMYPQYKSGDIIKLNVFGRKKYPQKLFGRSTQQEQYMIPEMLPTSSFYALKDNQTGEIIVDFDNYTQISCTYPIGNYFVIDTTGLPQERYYRVLIKINNGTSSYTVDTGKTFKIIR